MPKEELNFVTRIEEMSDDELQKRIEYSMNVELVNKIRPVPYMGEIEQTVQYEYPELIARCPMTRIMDLYTIRFKYIPDKYVPELKSLKLFLWNFDPIPISHEHLFARIWKEFKETIQPNWFRLELDVSPRGEMTTTISKEQRFLF
jgi:7-cyano-7-deazaguanine reductase